MRSSLSLSLNLKASSSSRQTLSLCTLYRSNEGGILHLVGNTDLFWSSIIYWHMHGTCMPISYAELGFKVPRPPTEKPPPEDDRSAGPRMKRCVALKLNVSSIKR